MKQLYDGDEKRFSEDEKSAFKKQCLDHCKSISGAKSARLELKDKSDEAFCSCYSETSL